LNQETINAETRWESESIIQNATSVKLIVEVVSTNWRDDYYDKFGDYEEMGIPEYWIIDYAGLGGRDFLGNPKQPAIFVCELVDGEYVKRIFRGSDVIVSPTFPQINLRGCLKSLKRYIKPLSKPLPDAGRGFKNLILSFPFPTREGVRG
jgi:Uma2 family endonuclease